MTVSSIILDLRGPIPIITNPNIVGMPVSCPTVEVIAMDICTWITSLGGWQTITAYDIMTLVRGYLGQTNLGFTITMAYINGAIAYYLDMLDSGNNFIGCSPT